MGNVKSFKVAALAASIALAMGSSAVMAAAPAAGQLPGKGTVVAGEASSSYTTGKQMDIALTDGATVIDWNKGTDLNKDGVAGFNIGKGGIVNFTGDFAVLNVDSTGNPSQIFGTLTGDVNVFVANTNGIIVGAGAEISSARGGVALIGNKLGGLDAFKAGGTISTLVYDGTGGDVTVQQGAAISGSTVLVAGGSNVNVDLGNVTSAHVRLMAGLPVAGGDFASKNTSANLAVTGGMNITQFDSAGTATTNGVLDLSNIDIHVAGLLTNNGELTVGGALGAVHNLGKLTTTFDRNAEFSSLTNDGTYTAEDGVNVSGGDLINNGVIDNAGSVGVTDGSIVNTGTMNEVNSLTTGSSADFTAGADYSITNSGTIAGAPYADLNVDANAVGQRTDDAKNDTTGSFANTGVIKIAASGEDSSSLNIDANDDLTLGGSLTVGGKALSAKNVLYAVDLNAGGVLTNSLPLFVSDYSSFNGTQVKLMADVTADSISVSAGDKMDADYAVRVATGKTLSADSISIGGLDGDVAPNVILQGTLAGNQVLFGSDYRDRQMPTAVSDVFSGPAGGIVLTGENPGATFSFTGAVKSASYLNASNFRYNYLPITVDADSTGTPSLTLNPVAYTTNGTSNGLSAVNILIDGSVMLGQDYAEPSVQAGGSAVTGVTNLPNTHLVLQSTGDITTDGDFYWPGYVYLGNVGTNADGSAAPGTLGYGKIVLGGDFNNVLPGDVSGAGGIHFITQFPLQMSDYSVTTNANSWVNFGTDLLTGVYAGGKNDGQFFGGKQQGAGSSVVNYGELDASMFHTHAPVATR